MQKLNPVKLALVYAVLHILVSIAIYFFLPDDGGDAFAFITRAISNLPYGVLVVTVVSCLIYRKWTVANWPSVLILLLIGLLPAIVYVIQLLFFKDADDVF